MAPKLDDRHHRRKAHPDTAPAKREQPQPDVKAETEKALQTDRNVRGVEQAKAKLKAGYKTFLKHMDENQKLRTEQNRVKIEQDYQVWVFFFEMMKRQFRDLWDFLGVVESEVEGWFRIAPNGGPWDFLGITREGYNFAAGVEQNTRSHAPFPKKWLMVSLACGRGWPNGIGDERMLGRKQPITEDLVGLEKLEGKADDMQVKAAAELRKRTKKFPLIFEMYSEKVGQKCARIPLSVLDQHSLTELCQGLFLALNNDELPDLQKLLPEGKRLELAWEDSSR